MTDRSHCRTCSAPILFVPLEPKGRMMPLDYEPNATGTVVREGQSYHVMRAGETLAPGAIRYRTHFATCPHARAHRRKAQS